MLWSIGSRIGSQRVFGSFQKLSCKRGLDYGAHVSVTLALWHRVFSWTCRCFDAAGTSDLVVLVAIPPSVVPCCERCSEGLQQRFHDVWIVQVGDQWWTTALHPHCIGELATSRTELGQSPKRAGWLGQAEAERKRDMMRRSLLCENV